MSINLGFKLVIAEPLVTLSEIGDVKVVKNIINKQIKKEMLHEHVFGL